MKIIINPDQSNNVIATVAIGDQYYKSWETYASPTWKQYCERYDLGLIVFDADLLSKENTKWKKPNWQKLLIGTVLEENLPTVKNVCYLDTDILINPTAPNVFEKYDPTTIALVSKRRRLPYPYDDVLRRIAFLRNRFYDQDYPLDSSLFISIEKLYEYHGLEVKKDEACTGVILFNVANHTEIMYDWFEKYDQSIESITGGGEQTHLNYEIQSWGNVSWLDYRYQAIWVFEMAWKYPFLYDYGRNNRELIKECIEASLFTNYFLHFAGSWHENEMWKMCNVLNNKRRIEFMKFEEYMMMPVTGEPKGRIKPV